MFPLSVGLGLDKFIWDVLAFTVRLALFVSVVPKFNGDVTDNVVVPEPKLTVLEFPLSATKLDAVKLYENKSIAPLVTVKVAFPVFKADPKVQPQPTPLTKTLDVKEFPFVVSVLPVKLPESVMLFAYVQVKPADGNVTSP